MYKCKECGTEFEEKPDYCDCGNDTFDEILPEELKTENDVTNVTKLNTINEVEIKKEDNQIQLQKTEKAIEPKTVEPKVTAQYDYSNLKQFFDPISTTIFCLCVLFAILIVLFVGNSFIKTETLSTQKTPEKLENIAIPEIDKLWNSTPPTKIETEKKSQEQVQITPQEQSQTLQKEELKPQTAKPTPKKQTARTQDKKASTTSATSNKATKSSKPQNKTVTKTQQTQNSAVLKQELSNYKISLRNRIASKMAFERIVGDGECVVAFKIDAFGRLVNRNFVKQSENDSLNDVVYNAIMQTPTFNVPPKAYKNEILYLKVRMYSGNYEVYLY